MSPTSYQAAPPRINATESRRRTRGCQANRGCAPRGRWLFSAPSTGLTGTFPRRLVLPGRPCDAPQDADPGLAVPCPAARWIGASGAGRGRGAQVQHRALRDADLHLGRRLQGRPGLHQQELPGIAGAQRARPGHLWLAVPGRAALPGAAQLGGPHQRRAAQSPDQARVPAGAQHIDPDSRGNPHGAGLAGRLILFSALQPGRLPSARLLWRRPDGRGDQPRHAVAVFHRLPDRGWSSQLREQVGRARAGLVFRGRRPHVLRLAFFGAARRQLPQRQGPEPALHRQYPLAAAGQRPGLLGQQRTAL